MTGSWLLSIFVVFTITWHGLNSVKRHHKRIRSDITRKNLEISKIWCEGKMFLFKVTSRWCGTMKSESYVWILLVTFPVKLIILEAKGQEVTALRNLLFETLIINYLLKRLQISLTSLYCVTWVQQLFVHVIEVLSTNIDLSNVEDIPPWIFSVRWSLTLYLLCCCYYSAS